MNDTHPPIYLYYGFLPESPVVQAQPQGKVPSSKARQRALARAGLQEILAQRGLSARLQFTPEGQPILVREDPGPAVYVSWSHCATALTWALSLGVPVGIDAESKVPPAVHWNTYLDPWLSADEKKWFQENPESFHQEDFLPFLTEKEAVFKVYSGAVDFQKITVIPQRNSQGDLFFHQGWLESGKVFFTACAWTKEPPVWELHRLPDDVFQRALFTAEQNLDVHQRK